MVPGSTAVYYRNLRVGGGWGSAALMGIDSTNHSQDARYRLICNPSQSTKMGVMKPAPSCRRFSFICWCNRSRRQAYDSHSLIDDKQNHNHGINPLDRFSGSDLQRGTMPNSVQNPQPAFFPLGYSLALGLCALDTVYGNLIIVPHRGSSGYIYIYILQHGRTTDMLDSRQKKST